MKGFKLGFSLGVFRVKRGHFVGVNCVVLLVGYGIADGDDFLVVLMDFDFIVRVNIYFRSWQRGVQQRQQEQTKKKFFHPSIP